METRDEFRRSDNGITPGQWRLVVRSLPSAGGRVYLAPPMGQQRRTWAWAKRPTRRSLEGESPKRPCEGSGAASARCRQVGNNGETPALTTKARVVRADAAHPESRCQMRGTSNAAAGFAGDAEIPQRLSGASAGECHKHMQALQEACRERPARQSRDDTTPPAFRPQPFQQERTKRSTKRAGRIPANTRLMATHRAMPAARLTKASKQRVVQIRQTARAEWKELPASPGTATDYRLERHAAA